MLALNIAQTFPSSRIPANIWEEELLDLHERQAETAVKQLRRKLIHPPSIKEFLDEYHSLTQRPTTTTSCEQCNNTGWVTDSIKNHPEHWPGKDDLRPAGVVDYGSEPNINELPHGIEPVPVFWCPCNVAVTCQCAIGENIKTSRKQHQQ